MTHARTSWRLGAVLLFPQFLATAALAQPAKYEGGCSSSGCHDGLLKRPVVHSPIEQTACDSCHALEDGAAHKFKLTESGAGLCTQCHEEELFQGPHVHQPVADGQCLGCHDPHGGKSKELLRLETAGAACMECHEETTEGLKHLHGPVGANECTACHAPHVSPNAKLLVKPGRELCLECHEDVRERFAESKHVHQAAESDCTGCHRPHGADNPAFTSAAVPSLCMDCHEEIGELAEAKFQHSPMKSQQSCTGCHDPHASAAAGLLAKSAGELCMSCHNQEVQSASRTVRSIAAELKRPNLHGPVMDGNCTACHGPHGSETPPLLAAAYPGQFYSAYGEDQYKLCFECHEASAFESAETDDATEFRNGRQNLHYIHVNKAQKGRTCRACHEPHGSTQPHHLAEAVKFGGWQLPLHYTETAEGGACLPGCHRPYRYDRENPVANLQTALGAANSSPETSGATR